MSVNLTLSKQRQQELMSLCTKQRWRETAAQNADEYLEKLQIPEEKRIRAKTACANPDQIEKILSLFYENKSPDIPESTTMKQTVDTVVCVYLTHEWLAELEYDIWNNLVSLTKIKEHLHAVGFDDPEMETANPSDLTEILTAAIDVRKLHINKLRDIMLKFAWT